MSGQQINDRSEAYREPPELVERLESAELVGMTLSVWADVQPDAVCVVDPDGTRHSFAEVNANANRIVRMLRDAGLQPGNAVALVCSNRAEFVEVTAATMRAGWRLTPVNWHLTAEEIAYIVTNCEAKAVFIDTVVTSADQVVNNVSVSMSVSIGEPLSGCHAYGTELARFSGADIEDPQVGNLMLYTSGTTGRPKGVLREAPVLQMPQYYDPRRYDRSTAVQMCPGPAYHAAPFLSDLRSAMGVGIPLVFTPRWNSETILATIQAWKVTHMHMVPIMFQRLLALPEEVRARYDVSSVVSILHGGAPCPTDVKRAMIGWFGPVLDEYYGASEGGSGFFIGSAEWLTKPGSVGKKPALLGSRILDEHNRECAAGVEGRIFQEVPPNAGFSYFKDPEKTNASRVDGYYTLGDMGYFDTDDYLFLSGRSAETIISGGVNIYPQEIDNVLSSHPAVADCATVGIPDKEWGEQVKSVVTLRPGFEASADLAEDILTYASRCLASFKRPRSIDFVPDLPRSEAGKIKRDKVRERYWQAHAGNI